MNDSPEIEPVPVEDAPEQLRPSARSGFAWQWIVEASCFLAIVLGPLVIVPIWLRPTDFPQLLMVKAAVGIGLMAFAYGLLERRKLADIGVPPLVGLAVAVYGGALLLSNVASVAPQVSFWGEYPFQHATSTQAQLAALGLLVLVASLRAPAQRERLALYVVGSGTLLSLIAIAQYLTGRDFFALGDVVVPQATFDNPLFLGTFLTGAATFTAALAARAWHRGHLGVLAPLALALTLQLTALILAAGRGPLLAMAVGSLVLVAWIARWRDRRATFGAAGVLVGSLIVAVGLTLVLPSGLQDSVDNLISKVDPAGDRLSSLERNLAGNAAIGGVDILSSGRTIVWRESVRVVLTRSWIDPTRPAILSHLLGFGPESSPVLLDFNYPDAMRFLDPRRVVFAHNIVLQQLLEVGWLGLAAFAALVTTCLVVATRAKPEAEEATTGDWLSAAAIASVIAFLVDQATNVPNFSGAIVFWVALGLAASGRVPADALPAVVPLPVRAPRPAAGLALGVFGLTLLATSVMWVRGEASASGAFAALQAGDFVSVEREVNSAISVAPWDAPYTRLLALVYRGVGLSLPDPSQRDPFLRRAAVYYDNGLSKDPWNAELLYNRAQVAGVLGANDAAEREVARQRYDRVLALAPADRASVAIDYAQALVAWGEPAAALSMLDSTDSPITQGRYQWHLFRGASLQLLGQTAQADLAFNRAIALASPPDRASVTAFRDQVKAQAAAVR